MTADIVDGEDWFAAQFKREALHHAAGDGDLGRVQALLAEGYPVNGFDELSLTPLHHAAQNEHLDVVGYLIAAGANVNAHDEQRVGNTVLRHVAPTCSLALARILLKAGADPTIPGKLWLTALDKSEHRESSEGPEVHRLLFEAAARRRPRWPRLTLFSLPTKEVQVRQEI